MSLDKLKEFKAVLLEKKHDNIDRVSEINSVLGQRMLDRKKLELQEVRESYNNIKVTDRQDHDVVLEFHAAQLRERFLVQDIMDMERPKKITGIVDNELRLCHDAIETKEQAASLER